MPTLQEVTEAHSRRISQLHQGRDADLRGALAARDAAFRSVPAAAALYAQFHKKVTAAAEDRMETERESADARAASLTEAGDRRSEALNKAQAKRKDGDLKALEQKTAAEAAAEKKFRQTLANLGPALAEEILRVSKDAARIRQRELEAAQEAYAKAMTAAQATFREAVEDALSKERSAGTTAERSYDLALRVSESKQQAALDSAERQLFAALQGLPEATQALQNYELEVTRIRSEAVEAERELFKRFQDELKTVGNS
jgi:hypothetical protein